MLINNQPLTPEIKDDFLYAAKAFVGSVLLYELSTDDDGYDDAWADPVETFLETSPPRMIVKALRALYEKNNLSYNQMVSKMYEILITLSQTYRFDLNNERLSSREGVIFFESGDSKDSNLKRLVKMGISFNETWEVSSANLSDIDKSLTSSRPNFISTVYDRFFDVPKIYKEHIIDNLPDINFPSYLLEAFIYLKYIQMPKKHDNEKCKLANEIYNRSVVKYSKTGYLIEHNLTINPTLDMRARNEKVHESLLLLFLTFPVSCKPEEIVWESLPYDKIINLYIRLLSYRREENIPLIGRVVSDGFYKDARKASYMLIHDTTVYEKQESNIFTGSDYYDANISKSKEDEIVQLMASSLPSNMWAAGSELPASWLDLL